MIHYQICINDYIYEHQKYFDVTPPPPQDVRCSSMIIAFVHGAMGRHINPSWWTHWAISCFSECFTTGVTKVMVCGMMHIKEPFLLIGMSSLCGGSRFPLSLSESSFTICLTPYNCK